MLKHLPVCFLAVLSLAHLSQGTFVSQSLFPSCTGNLTGFPNFSYAKSLINADVSYPCTTLNTQHPPPPLTVTWYYYDTYPAPVCGNPSLPDGDQCCHSTATSTITFYSVAYVVNPLNTVGTASGNVTAGAFLGQSVTWAVTRDAGTVNLNCNTAYGKEAAIGTANLIVTNGPSCLNGGMMQEICPGWH